MKSQVIINYLKKVIENPNFILIEDLNHFMQKEIIKYSQNYLMIKVDYLKNVQ
jgi:hypothetical protein